MWKTPISRPQHACQIALESKNYLVRPPGEMINNLLTFLRQFIYTHNSWTVTKSCFLEPSRGKLCLSGRRELHGLVERPGPLPAGASVNTNLSSLMSWMPALFFLMEHGRVDVARSMGKKLVGRGEPESSLTATFPLRFLGKSGIGCRWSADGYVRVYIHARGTKQRGHFWCEHGLWHSVLSLYHPFSRFSSIVCVIYFMDEQHSDGFCVIIHVFFADSLGVLPVGVARWRETCRNMTCEERRHKHCCPARQICTCLSAIIKHWESFFFPLVPSFSL